VIVVDANTVQLAASLADALAGTAIDLEDQGTADKTLTFTPTSLAGGVIHVEGSNDKATWFDVLDRAGNAATANMTTSSSTQWHFNDLGYHYIRVTATVTAGQVTISGTIAQKGPTS
jgi:hypothetical protein